MTGYLLPGAQQKRTFSRPKLPRSNQPVLAESDLWVFTFHTVRSVCLSAAPSSWTEAPSVRDSPEAQLGSSLSTVATVYWCARKRLMLCLCHSCIQPSDRPSPLTSCSLMTRWHCLYVFKVHLLGDELSDILINDSNNGVVFFLLLEKRSWVFGELLCELKSARKPRASGARACELVYKYKTKKQQSNIETYNKPTNANNKWASIEEMLPDSCGLIPQFEGGLVLSESAMIKVEFGFFKDGWVLQFYSVATET